MTEVDAAVDDTYEVTTRVDMFTDGCICLSMQELSCYKGLMVNELVLRSEGQLTTTIRRT